VIGHGVLLCDSASVFDAVTVGDDAVIGAGVTLFQSVPDGAVVVAKQELKIRLSENTAAVSPATRTPRR